MSEQNDRTEQDPQTPVWIQGRQAVIDATPPQQWRDAPPDYHLSAVVMPKERWTSHADGSLEQIAENLVQAFEMEASYKGDPQTWLSMDVSRFRSRVNGGPWTDADRLAEIGTYNALINPGNDHYDSTRETFHSSHAKFRGSMPGGFFWEVLQVLSGPPTVTFKWRHWGRFEGEYPAAEGASVAPTGQQIEMFGMTVAHLDDDLKIVELEHFYDADQLLAPLATGCPVAHEPER